MDAYQRVMETRKMNQKGFTLIESLIVLAIVQVMVLIIVINLKPLMAHYQLTSFLRQLQADTFYTQQIAITTQRPARLTFELANSRYLLLKIGAERPIMQRGYHSNIRVVFSSGTSSIQYNEQGNISQAKSLFISSNKETYKVTFQIGRGRFYVTKI
ncbi:competence type IV pilus minor pilin ComGD [Priestia flexa]|uniref:competence type IV pilus minor pilin ComGD n=1 Tax=Bacillaceae TaxID=186817 RepID=UPI001E5534E5|nr:MULTISPECIES: competence type IV pilus minor pilin ComGD [Bacillaceae]